MFDRIWGWTHAVLCFLCWTDLITDMISTLVIDLFIFLISSWFSFGNLYIQKYPFLLDLLLCWHIVNCNSFRLFYVCLRHPLLYYIYFFIWNDNLHREGKTQREDVLFIGSFPKWLQWAKVGLSEVQSFFQFPQMSVGTWAIFCCFPSL